MHRLHDSERVDAADGRVGEVRDKATLDMTEQKTPPMSGVFPA